MNWISVYDAMPDPEQDVLVFCERKIGLLKLRPIVRVSRAVRNGLFKIEQDANYGQWVFVTLEVTHWMPLPDDPPRAAWPARPRSDRRKT